MESCVSVVSDPLMVVGKTPDSRMVGEVSAGTEHIPYEMPIDLQADVFSGKVWGLLVGLMTTQSVLHDSIPFALSLCFRMLTEGCFAG